MVGDALRRAQENNDVDVFALIAMSNYIHMVIRTPKRRRDFKSMVTKHANRVHGRNGPLWARRADVQPILDDDAAAARLAYTIDNPRRANLVADPEQWPGLSLCFGLGETDEVPFEYFDFKAWRKARRPVDKAPFFKRAALRLSPLPAADCGDREAYAENVRCWLMKQVDQEQQDAQRQGIEAQRGATLGVETIIKAAFDQRPKAPKRSPRPYCFGSQRAKREPCEMTQLVNEAHEVASAAYRAGDRIVNFPIGTYAPPIMSAAA